MYAQQLIEIAILGLDRRTLPARFQPSDASGSPPDDAALLLCALARAHYQCKAATPLLQMTQWPAATPPAPTTLVCSERSAQHLHEILYGPYRPVLPEFLQALQASGRCLPYRHLPAMLDLALKNADLADAIVALAGDRGVWLSQQVARWQALFVLPDPARWPLAGLEERTRILRHVRRQNPAQGMALLLSTWKQDGVRERSKLLPVLETGLSPAEEDFLENCLYEKHKEVRQAAARLLTLLPDSTFNKRLQGYAASMFSKGMRGGNWEIHVPDQLPNDWERDLAHLSASTLGSPKATILRQIVGSIHPNYWTALLDARREEILRQWYQSQWSAALLQGLAAAIQRHRASAWADAIAIYSQQHDAQRIPGLDEALAEWITPAALLEVIHHHLARHGGIVHDGSLSLYLLQHGNACWPDEVALALIKGLQNKMGQHRGHTSGLWHYRALLRQAAAFKINPRLCTAIEQGWHPGAQMWPEWDKDIQFFLQALAFRHDMLAALAV